MNFFSSFVSKLLISSFSYLGELLILGKDERISDELACHLGCTEIAEKFICRNAKFVEYFFIGVFVQYNRIHTSKTS